MYCPGMEVKSIVVHYVTSIHVRHAPGRTNIHPNVIGSCNPYTTFQLRFNRSFYFSFTSLANYISSPVVPVPRSRCWTKGACSAVR